MNVESDHRAPSRWVVNPITRADYRTLERQRKPYLSGRIFSGFSEFEAFCFVRDLYAKTIFALKKSNNKIPNFIGIFTLANQLFKKAKPGVDPFTIQRRATFLLIELCKTIRNIRGGPIEKVYGENLALISQATSHLLISFAGLYSEERGEINPELIKLCGDENVGGFKNTDAVAVLGAEFLYVGQSWLSVIWEVEKWLSQALEELLGESLYKSEKLKLLRQSFEENEYPPPGALPPTEYYSSYSPAKKVAKKEGGAKTKYKWQYCPMCKKPFETNWKCCPYCGICRNPDKINRRKDPWYPTKVGQKVVRLLVLGDPTRGTGDMIGTVVKVGPAKRSGAKRRGSKPGFQVTVKWASGSERMHDDKALLVVEENPNDDLDDGFDQNPKRRKPKPKNNWIVAEMSTDDGELIVVTENTKISPDNFQLTLIVTASYPLHSDDLVRSQLRAKVEPFGGVFKRSVTFLDEDTPTPIREHHFYFNDMELAIQAAEAAKESGLSGRFIKAEIIDEAVDLGLFN